MNQTQSDITQPLQPASPHTDEYMKENVSGEHCKSYYD